VTVPSANALREQYPGLAQLLGAYFHQDWALDDRSPDDVLRRFQRGEPPATVQRAGADAARVLQSHANDADVAAVLERLGSSYHVAADGLTARAWLARVGERLAAAG
jgi:hypothetical protein